MPTRHKVVGYKYDFDRVCYEVINQAWKDLALDRSKPAETQRDKRYRDRVLKAMDVRSAARFFIHPQEIHKQMMERMDMRADEVRESAIKRLKEHDNWDFVNTKPPISELVLIRDEDDEEAAL